jgi:hypothetical protein
MQNLFFHRDNESDPNGFIDEVLAYAESIKQPFSVGEGLSIHGLFDFGYSPDFAGPVQFFLAEFDFLVCGGDCDNNFVPLAYPKLYPKLYPNASSIDIHVQPGSGHGLVLHRNASAGYAVQLQLLDENGL